MGRTHNLKISLRLILVLAFLAATSATTAATVGISSFFGGVDGDNSYDICTDLEGNYAISGRTYGSDFPLLNAADSSFGGTFDAIVRGGCGKSDNCLRWI